MHFCKKIIHCVFYKGSKKLVNESTKWDIIQSQIRSLHKVKKLCNETVTLSTLQKTTTDGRVRCTLIPGDGIGPELVRSVKQVFKQVKIPVDFEILYFSEVDHKLSASLNDVVSSISKNKVCIHGVLETPYTKWEGFMSLNTKFKKALELYANVVHFKSLPNVKSKFQDVDCILIREQIEGEYSALEHVTVPGVVESIKIVTARKSRSIAKFAFDYAIKNGRKRITAVHKANIMKLSDGLFLKSCKELSVYYPRIQYDTLIVDNCTMQLVSNPKQFDVLLLPNLYGDILTSLTAGIVGGAGVVAGSSYSPDVAVFEQGARHVFLRAVNKNICNPTGILLSSVDMLKHINLQPYANFLEKAIYKVLADGIIKTRDVGGRSSTQDFTEAVIKNYPCKD